MSWRTDKFLSREDLDIGSLSEVELLAWWYQWLLIAQATNEADARTYSHGVFTRMLEPVAGDEWALTF